MPAKSDLNSALDRQLLLQLGARLKRARKAQGLTTTQMAERAGISRMTLSAIESGEPTPTMGSYLRVMSTLQVSKDLILVANDALHSPAESARTTGAVDTTVVTTSNAKHELQDLQSLMLHEEAVRLMQKQPALVQQALDTLDRWRESGTSPSRFLWDEWAVILHRRAWRRALSNSKRSKELRQASPLTTVLPEDTRRRILDEVKELKSGVTISLPTPPARRTSRHGT